MVQINYFLFNIVCGTKQITMDEGDIVNISSPNYPKYYLDNQECWWLIQAQDNGSFVVTIVDMLLYGFGLDYLQIGRGLEQELLLPLTHVIPAGSKIAIEDSNIWMYFFTNSGQRQRGFYLEVERLAKNGN